MMIQIKDIKKLYDEDEFLLFWVSARYIQDVARLKIGRMLTENELYRVSRGLESELNFDLDNIVVNTAIDEAINP